PGDTRRHPAFASRALRDRPPADPRRACRPAREVRRPRAPLLRQRRLGARRRDGTAARRPRQRSRRASTRRDALQRGRRRRRSADPCRAPDLGRPALPEAGRAAILPAQARSQGPEAPSTGVPCVTGQAPGTWFSARTAIVTGAARGIGRATAELLSTLGAR